MSFNPRDPEQRKDLHFDLKTHPEIEHRSSCPAVADDESDYEHLSDAGMCVCGA